MHKQDLLLPSTFCSVLLTIGFIEEDVKTLDELFSENTLANVSSHLANCLPSLIEIS